jgi:ssDNA-binding Zn-finger/Zn-ribbon topoisomerase 1
MKDFIPREALMPMKQNFAKNFRIKTEKEDWIEGSRCPNCYKGKLQASKAVKSEHDSRYHHMLVCPACKFTYLKKFAITKSGKVRSAVFTDSELKKATDKLVLKRSLR